MRASIAAPQSGEFKMKIVSGTTRPTLIAMAMSIAFLSGCDRAPQNAAQTSVPSTSAPAPATAPVKHDVVADNIDTTVNPGDDFFTFANGAWLKKNPIPATEASWGIGFLVRDDLYDKLRKISEDSAQKSAAPGSDEQKIGDFWHTAMDLRRSRRSSTASTARRVCRTFSMPRSPCSRSARRRCSTEEFSKTKNKAM
jgi:hypothetical protein